MKQSLPPEDPHQRPGGVDDKTIEGVGKLSEALEMIERARGALYDLHQLIGGADNRVVEAADILESAGHAELAQMLRQDVIGMNVLPGRWTFQIVEEFDEGYYKSVNKAEAEVRQKLVGGRRHVYESEMKERNRTKGLSGHEARP